MLLTIGSADRAGPSSKNNAPADRVTVLLRTVTRSYAQRGHRAWSSKTSRMIMKLESNAPCDDVSQFFLMRDDEHGAFRDKLL